MAKWGKVDFSELLDYQKKIEKLVKGKEIDAFLEDCAKELAMRILALAIDETPVGQYPEGSGKVGGTLRRNWMVGTKGTTGGDWASSQVVRKEGNNYIVEITNPTEYASYVEYGHRTKDKKGFVKGRFMLTNAVNQIQGDAQAILAKKILAFFKENGIG